MAEVTHVQGMPAVHEGNGKAPPKVWKEHQEPIGISVQGKDGKVRNYEIREWPNGDPLSAWMEMTKARALKVSSKGIVLKANTKDLQADLISLCLYDEGGSLVPKHTIASWGAKLQAHLFVECQKMQGIAPDDDAEGKD